MRILIGTPVHESKDYSMDKWLASVSKFDYPFDLLMVDNSPDFEYLKKIHEYCKKHGVTNYKLVHINVEPDAILDEKLAQSREVIRKKVLDEGYDAWLSLECDVIAPSNTITKLISLVGDNWMVSHGYPSRDNPDESNVEFGVTLIMRMALERYGFLGQYGYVDVVRPNSWYGNDVWFIRRIDRDDEGKRIHFYGNIKPIYHLKQ